MHYADASRRPRSEEHVPNSGLENDQCAIFFSNTIERDACASRPQDKFIWRGRGQQAAMTTSTSSSGSTGGAVVVARTKKSPSSLLVPSLSTILLCGLALRLAVFLVPDLSAIPALLERRPELSTPVSSYLTCAYLCILIIVGKFAE